MKKVIVDVDTGVDDAQAILLALKSPELKVEAITAVSGNVHVDKTSINCLRVLEIAGVKDVPVAKGAPKPLIGEPHLAEYAHGKDGLGNTNLPPPKLRLDKKSAVDMIIDTVMANPNEVTLVPVGPLTNIALAVLKEPRLVGNVKEIVLMGGAFGVTPYGYGNVSPVGEFNVWADPEAAWIVFHSGIPTTAVGLDLSQNPAACLREEHLGKFTSATTPVADFVVKLSKFRMAFGEGVSHLHDPLAVAVTADRSLVKTEKLYVDVELAGTTTRGMTVADRRPEYMRKLLGAPALNVEVCSWLNAERFLQIFIKRLTEK